MDIELLFRFILPLRNAMWCSHKRIFVLHNAHVELFFFLGECASRNTIHIVYFVLLFSALLSLVLSHSSFHPLASVSATISDNWPSVFFFAQYSIKFTKLRFALHSLPAQNQQESSYCHQHKSHTDLTRAQYSCLKSWVHVYKYCVIFVSRLCIFYDCNCIMLVDLFGKLLSIRIIRFENAQWIYVCIFYQYILRYEILFKVLLLLVEIPFWHATEYVLWMLFFSLHIKGKRKSLELLARKFIK